MDIFLFPSFVTCGVGDFVSISIPTLFFGWHQDPLFCIQSPATRDRENQILRYQIKSIDTLQLW